MEKKGQTVNRLLNVYVIPKKEKEIHTAIQNTYKAQGVRRHRISSAERMLRFMRGLCEGAGFVFRIREGYG